MRKYANTKYDHVQPPKSKQFWESIFEQHYQGLFEGVEWYDGGDSRDVEDKQDCHIVLVNGFRDFQVKDQITPFHEITINLNVKTFNNYSQGNYALNGFGIGIIWDNTAYLIEATAMLNCWLDNYDNWKRYKKGRNDNTFLAIPEKVFISKFDKDAIKRYVIKGEEM